MNNFSISTFENGTFTPITGVAVFPFNFGKLLDEKLDEAYVTIMRDSRQHYENNTLMGVTLNQSQGEPVHQFYIVANDNGFECPIGSGKYTHKLYLIEVTKRLEAVYCQSLCFTNASGNMYLEGAKQIPLKKSVWGEDGLVLDGYTVVDGYNNILDRTSSFQTKSIDDVLYAIVQSYNTQNPSSPSLSAIIAPYGETITQLTKIEIFVRSIETGENVLLISETAPADTESADFEQRFSAYKNKSYSVVLSRSTEININYYINYKTAYIGSENYGRTVGMRVSYTAKVTSNKYPTKRLTVLDCCNRVLNLAEPLFYWSDLNGNLSQPRYRIDPTQTAWLESVLAPEFTMTQCTLREQLRVIGGFIHAEPRLLWDSTKNDGSFLVHFDRYGIVNQSAQVQNATPYITKKVSQDINNYCTKIETSASNIVNTLDYASGVVAMPDASNYKTLRTESVNTRITDEGGIVPTSFPIREIRNVRCTMYDNNGGIIFGVETGGIDITPYIFEKTEYDANLSSFEGGYPTSKSFALYYGIGQKNIGGLFFKPTPETFTGSEYTTFYSIVNIIASIAGDTPELVRDTIMNNGGYSNLAFNIQYVPIYNARFSLEKQYIDPNIENDYAKVYNQGENQIESRYYGENVRGVVQRMGNVEQERTYVFNDLSQVPNIGDMVDNYAISAVSTSFQPTYIKCTVALTKDFNRISQYIGVNSAKRVYEVSEREAYQRNVLLKEYIVASVGSENYTPKGAPIFKDLNAIRSIFDVRFAALSPVSRVFSYSTGKDYNDAGGNIQWFGSTILPVISSAFGNSMVFSWNYKDNYSAGEKSIYGAIGDITGRWQQDVPYSDYYGKNYWYQFSLVYNTSETTTNMAGVTPYGGAAYAYNIPEGVGLFPTSTISTGDDSLQRHYPYLMQKDSREAINVTYAVEFRTTSKKLIIGNALAKNCGLVCGRAGASPRLYVFYEQVAFGETVAPKIDKFQRSIADMLSQYEYIDCGSFGGEAFGDYLSAPMEYNTNGTSDVKLSLPDMSADSTWQPSGSTAPIFAGKTVTAWAIATPPVIETIQVVDDSGTQQTQTITSGGEVLLACNEILPTDTQGILDPFTTIHLTPTHRVLD